jgi:hypothetical protein
VSRLIVSRTIGGAITPFAIEDAEAKLRWRAGLPGASVWDRAAHSLRTLQIDDADPVELLSLALPASWMVSSQATSRAMQRWLSPPMREAWRVVLTELDFAMAPEEWLACTPARREAVVGAITALVQGGEGDGASLAAVSKVLALLRPQLVPLMDDAALWFALELVPEPERADRPVAPPRAFAPMLDWFCEQVIACEAPLVALATRHDLAVLDAAQTLDRLLWVESWGDRLRQPARERLGAKSS